MSEYIIPVEMEVDDGQAAFNMEVAEQINVVSGTDVSDTTAVEEDVLSGKKFHKANGDLAIGTFSIPTPTNLITNGDFSAAGATTDGWSAIVPAKSSLSISDGRLVLTLDTPQSNTYGVQYSVNTTAGHTYLINVKVKKTLNDADADAKVINCLFGTTLTNYMRYTGVAQNDVIDSTFALEATENNSVIRIQFGGSISSSAITAGESMFEFFHVKMYDITDIISGW